MNARGVPTAAYQVLICCPVTGGYPPAGGTPPWVPLLDLTGGTHPCWRSTPPRVPHIRPGWGVPYPCQGYPASGTPLLDLVEYPPPHWTWLWYPPSDLAEVPHVRPGWGTPLRPPGQVEYPLVDRQTDRHVSKHNFPYVRGR